MKLVRSLLPWLLALCLLQVACQPLPHPFAGQHLKAGEVFRAVPDAVGIVVHPVAGAPQAADAALRRGMIAGLINAEIPAQTGPGNHASYRLDSVVVGPVPVSGPFALKIRWVLSTHKGRVVGRREQTTLLDAAEWQGGANVLIATARAEAAQIAPLIQPPAAVERAAAHPIYIAPVVGAPGDGNESLPRALAYMFERAGIALTTDAKAAGAIRIEGKVHIDNLPPAQQKITIVWRIVAPNGTATGQVSQDNTLPAGMLDGPWAEVSIAVAEAGFDQIEGLVQRAGGE